MTDARPNGSENLAYLPGSRSYPLPVTAVVFSKWPNIGPFRLASVENNLITIRGSSIFLYPPEKTVAVRGQR